MIRRSEFVKGLGQLVKRSLVVGAVFVAVLGPDAYAGPEGAIVVNGQVYFQHNGNWHTISASDGAIINYSSFNVLHGETVQFIQPGDWARVLNRITGPDPTSINGTLLSNGQVYFVNPAGIMFGPNSVINVGSIHAAAGKLSNQDFLNGVDHFFNLQGAVINQGAIHADSVHLIGQAVANHGMINANGGVLTMLAGNDVMMKQQGDNIVVRVDGHKLTDQAMPHGGTTAPGLDATAGVLNTGTINAAKGQVVLGAGDFYSLAVNNEGMINAESGRVTLAASDGLVRNAGVVDTSSILGDGGMITMQGPSVLNEGDLLANSQNNQAGSVEVTSMNHTYLLDDSRIEAAGIGAHADGGNVLVHSYEGLTVFNTDSSIDVSGGHWGEGGFAEVSGYNLLFRGDVKLTATNAKAASLLIDPRDLYVVNGDEINTMEGDLLFSGQGGEILFGDPDDMTDLYLSAQILEGFLGGDITLEASRNLYIQYRVNLLLANNVGVILKAGRHIFLHAPIINATSLTMMAGQLEPIGTVQIKFNDFEYLFVQGMLEIEGIDVEVHENLYAPGIKITSANPISLMGGNLQVIGAGPGSLEVNNAISKIGAGDLWLSGTDVNLMGDVSTELGSLRVTGLNTLETKALSAGLNVLVLNAGPGTANIDGDVTAGTSDLFNESGNADFFGNVLVGGNVLADVDVTFHHVSEINGAVTATKGTARFLDSTTVEGDVTAGADALFNGTATFDGTTDQTVMAGGRVDFDMNASKINTGGLTASGETGVDIGGDIDSVGNLRLASGSGDINFDNDGNDQSATANGGTLNLDANVTKASGKLTLTGSAGMNIGWNVSTDAGDLELTVTDAGGMINFDGADAQSATATGGTLDVNAAEVQKGTGDLTLAGQTDLTIDGNVSADGDLTLDSADGMINFDGGDAQTASAGGTLELDADVEKATEKLTLAGTTAVNIEGNVTATTGDLEINSDGVINFDGATAQAATAGGMLDLNADINKDTESLTLEGASGIFVEGNATVSAGKLEFVNFATFDGPGVQTVNVAGELLFGMGFAKTTAGGLDLTGTDGITVTGDGTTLSGNLIFNNETTLNAIGAQAITAGGAGQLRFERDVIRTGGVLNLTGGGGIFARGNFVGNDTIRFISQTIFNGADPQSAMAGGSLIFLQNLAKVTNGKLILGGTAGIKVAGNASTSNGDLAFLNDTLFNGVGQQNVLASGASVLDFDGNVSRVGGSLNMQGNNGIQAAGNVNADGRLRFASEARFDGTGDQTAAAGADATFKDDVRKTTAGDLTIAGATGITVTGDKAFTADGDLAFNGNTTLDADSAQAVRAIGGMLMFMGNLSKVTNGALTLGGNTGVDASGNVLVSGGDLTVENALALSGSKVTASGNASFLDGITMDGDLDQRVNTIDGDIVILGGLTKTTDGALSVASAGELSVYDGLSHGGDGDMSVTTGEGDITIMGGLAKTADGALSVASAGELSVYDGLSQAGNGDMSITSGDGDITVIGDVIKTGAGNVVIEAAQVMDFDGSINVSNDLRLNTRSPDSTTTAIGGLVVPLRATIAVRGSGRSIKAGGNLTMDNSTVFEKLVAFDVVGGQSADNGMFTLEAGGTATLGDVASYGDLVVTADTIRIWTRPGERVQRLDSDDKSATTFLEDGRVNRDLGTDFAALRTITFNAMTIGVNDASGLGFDSPFFGTFDGEGISQSIRTRFPGATRAMGNNIIQFDRILGDVDSDTLTPEGVLVPTVFDVAALGPNDADVSSALATAVPDDSEIREVGQGLALDLTDIETLRLMGIYARTLTDGELLGSNSGFIFADDVAGMRASMAESGVVDPSGIDQTNRVVALNRIDDGLKEQVFAEFNRLDERKMSAALRDAWTTFNKEIETEGMTADEIGRSFREFVATREEHQEAHEALNALGNLFGRIETLCLNDAELQGSQQFLALKVMPRAMKEEAFRAAIGLEGAF